VDPKQFRELIFKLLNGDIKKREFEILKNYTKGIIRNVSAKLAHKHGGSTGRNILELLKDDQSLGTKEPLDYVFEELLIKIFSKKEILIRKQLDDIAFKKYVNTMIYNLIADLMRSRSKAIPLKTDKGEKAIEKIRDDVFRIVRFELKHSILNSLTEDDIKYLCYLLSSRRYKCLWTGKKESAIYQDVKRNKEKALNNLRGIIHDLNLDEEAYEDVIKPVLSEICEDLRNKKCKGGDS